MLGKLGGEIWWGNLHLPLVGKIKFFPTTSEIWWEMAGKRIFWWEKVALPRGYAHFPHHFSHRFPVEKKKTPFPRETEKWRPLVNAGQIETGAGETSGDGSGLLIASM